MSKASKGRMWFENEFVDMRSRKNKAYHITLEDLASILSTDNVDWLLGSVAGWKVALNTPIECIVTDNNEIVGKHELWNCAEKTRWMADRKFYGHILTKAYVEHPYEKQHTKAYIIEGVKAALKSGLSTRAITEQVKVIIDARLDCVLLPSSENPKSNHPHDSVKEYLGNKLDGMVAKYSEIKLVDHDTKAVITKADLQGADDVMSRLVENAMTILMGRSWKITPHQLAPRRGRKNTPARVELHGAIAQPEARSEVTLLERNTWADFDSALARLGFDPAAPTDDNSRTKSWTIKTPTQMPVFGSIKGQKLPAGDVFTISGTKKKLTSLNPAALRHIIDEYVQAGITVVY